MQKPSLLITVKGELKNMPPLNGRVYQLEELQVLIDGYIQILPTPLEHIMIIDEEGKIKKKAPNLEATMIMSSILAPGDYIAGDVIYCDPSMVE